MMLSISSCVGHLCILFGEVLFSDLLTEFIDFLDFLFLSFRSSLSVLDTSLLTDMCSANIFSEAVACLLTL